MIQLAYAADRRAAVDTDRMEASPATDMPRSNQPISPAHGAGGNKPAARRSCGTRWDTDGQTDGHCIIT